MSRASRLQMRLPIASSSGERKTSEQAVVASEHDGEDGGRIELGGGEQAQLAECADKHLLGLVDERTDQRRLDVHGPLLAQGKNGAPAVVPFPWARRRDRRAASSRLLSLGVNSFELLPPADSAQTLK